MLGEDTITTLANRIFEKIETNPKILAITNAWDLLDIDDLEFGDLQPSLAQARHALIRAQERYEAMHVQTTQPV